MECAIIISKKDIAGMNIREKLINNHGFKEIDENYDENVVYSLKNIKLFTINNDTIHSENLDKEIDADLFVFATRHSAKQGRKTLCLHTPGNWDKGEMGGKNRNLCVSAPGYLKRGLQLLNEFGKDLDYDKTLEVTHHGPYMEKPCFFIEIGSTEEEWRDDKAAEIISKTIIELLSSKIPEYRTCIGLGGPHYGNSFNKILLNTEYAVGHICPKYALEILDEDLIKKAIERNNVKVVGVLLDWKGLGGEKQNIKQLLEKLNIKYERIKNIS